jgi:hypothetical protein
MNISRGSILAVALLVSGCEEKKEPTGAAAPTATAAPAGCTDEDTKLEDLGVCIRVPKDWDFDNSKKTRPVWYGKGEMLSINLGADDTLESWLTTRAPQGCTWEEGPLAGGKGRWRYRPVCGNATMAEFSIAVTSTKGLVRCSFQDPDDAKVKRQLELCKTIQPL